MQHEDKPRTVDALQAATDDFFRKHWDRDSNRERPRWKGPWKMVGNLPDGDKQGVYAIFKEDEVIYIGVGASRNSGNYAGAGIGARFWAYIKTDRPVPKKIGENTYSWKGKWSSYQPDGVMTLGFEPGDGYLAYALEPYLIMKIDPKVNTVKPGQVEPRA